MSKIDKFIKTMPPELKPQSNPMLNALLRAWAGEDEEIMTQLENTKAQLFVKTAEGIYLDRLASNYGVSRPFELGLLDADFQKLIPNLSLKQKQVTKSFYDTMDVFWGPTFSRANATSANNEPYAYFTGDSLEISIDGGATQKITIIPGDIRIPGQATTSEMRRILARIEGLSTEVVVDPATGDNRLSLRTDTPGPRGSIEFISGFGPMGMIEGVKNRVIDLAQRTVLYQISAGEVLIELPAIVPTLRRTLKGSHHFHADATLEGPVPPANGIWQGSFLYSTTDQNFLLTSIKGDLGDPVLKGDVLNELTVSGANNFPLSGGKLVIDYGKANEEANVSYITIANANTILIDPGYVFQHNHNVGATVNLLAPNQTTPYAPRKDGEDLAIYLTSPANARDVVQSILRTLAAAGIIVNFLILLPTYTYIIQNPFEI